MRIRLWAAGLVLSIGAASVCRAHEGDFVISRDNAQPPKLHLNGPSNLLDGTECIDLLPGDANLAGYWFNDAPGFSTMRRDGDIRGRRRLLPGHRISLRLIHSPPGFCLLEPSTWRPVLSDKLQTYSFFLSPQGEFSIQMVPRCEKPGPYQATFQLVDLAGLHADSEPFTLCFKADVELELARSANQFLQLAPPNCLRPAAALAYPICAEVLRTRGSGVADLHGHVHSPARQFTPPLNFHAGIDDLRSRVHEVDEWIATRKFNYIPPDAEALAQLIPLIPLLALDPLSGVPRNDCEALVRGASTAAARCVPMAMSAQLSDEPAVREHWQILSGFLASCDGYIPARYICPMRCEGEKTFDAPGRCPVCGMALVDSRAHQDHRPKHGGIFFMAPDGRHHLEGTVAEGREFRLYFYNEFTRPIPAGAFQTRAFAGGNTEATPLKLSLGPKAEYQFAGINSIVSPLRVKLFIEFGDDAGPQVFDFDFPP